MDELCSHFGEKFRVIFQNLLLIPNPSYHYSNNGTSIYLLKNSNECVYFWSVIIGLQTRFIIF